MFQTTSQNIALLCYPELQNACFKLEQIERVDVERFRDTLLYTYDCHWRTQRGELLTYRIRFRHLNESLVLCTEHGLGPHVSLKVKLLDEHGMELSERARLGASWDLLLGMNIEELVRSVEKDLSRCH